MEDHFVLAVEIRMQFFDLFDVDDCAAMNSDELCRMELTLQIVHGFPDKM